MARRLIGRVGVLGGGVWGLLVLNATPAQADPPEQMQVATSEPAACTLVPTLHDCSAPPPAVWPSSELFSFVLSCPPSNQNEPARSDDGALGPVTIEQVDLLGGQCPRL